MAAGLGWNFTPTRDYRGDWPAYFHEYTGQLAAFKLKNNGDAEAKDGVKVVIKRNYESVLIQPAVEIGVDDLPNKSIREVALLLGGRKLSIRWSRTRQVGAVFASGPRAGEKRADKILDHYGIATVDKLEPVVTAHWTEPSVFDFADFGWLNGKRTRVTSVTGLKKLIMGATMATEYLEDAND